MLHDFLAQLPARLAQPLPGWDAQRRMAPANRSGETPDFTHKPGMRYNGVLVLCLPTGQGFEVLLTLRAADLKLHKGQISFPGGGIEAGEDAVQAALREAREEVGLDSSQVRVLGQLSQLYVPPSNSLIYPVVATAPAPAQYVLEPNEVAEAFTVPFEKFVDAQYRQVLERTLHDGSSYLVPSWNVHPSTPLWGATAIILSELLALYEEFTAAHSAV